LDKAREAAKDHKNINRVLENKLRAILHPLVITPGGEEIPQAVPKGRFKDPMAAMAGKQG
jgi:hypothetical protein